MNWKDIPNAENYEVNKDGRIRMKATNVFNRGRLYFRKPKMLKQYEDKDGYKFVVLFPSMKRNKEGKREKVKKYVHRVVMEAFVGPCPDEQTVDHINRKRNDNRLVNLRYADIQTQANNRDLSRISGENSKFAKLNLEQVRKIRSLREEGYTYVEISRKFRVSSTTVARICKNQSWKD